MEFNPAFVSDLTTNLKVIANTSYEARNRNLWWTRVAAQKRSESKKEVVAWLLDQWKLRNEDTDGQVEFERIVARTHEYVHGFESTAIELFESDFEDLDGHGVQVATAFARKMGAEFAYSPQRQLAAQIISNPTCYDGQSFFSASHPVSGKATDLSLSTYSNLITGKPIFATDGSVNIDTAKANLGYCLAKARTMKSPDGGPRSLTPAGLLVPSEMATRAADLLGARFIGASGSTDHTAALNVWGLGGLPIVADELSADAGGSATTFYILMTETTSDDLGAFVWSVRKDYAIKYPSYQDALYQESGKLRFVAKGRTGLVTGHPFLMVKCTA